MAAINVDQKDDSALVRPLAETGRLFYGAVCALLLVIAWAIFAWSYQLRHGLAVTGLNRPIFWGFYITNFVFFIGISHAGTLVSAILRLCHAEWRRPITRAAETITVLVLFFGVANILADLGRPDRAFFVLRYPHLQSPLLWDVISVSLYLTVSSLYLYLPLIPDIALLKEKFPNRRWFYRILSLNWKGTERQWHFLERAIGVMAILVIPIAVTVHTVVSWVFSMTVQPMWHSTIFGPYFVVGAIFSGIAALILAMALIRRCYHLEAYLQPVHFHHLGLLLLTMTCLWFYFTFAEHLTSYYGSEPTHMAVFWMKVKGIYSPYFWAMCCFCFVIPFAILASKGGRYVSGTVVASLSVTIGMWLERFMIVIPTLANPRLPYERGIYYPTWVEWSIMAGCFAGFIFLYLVFTKFFPIISIWEIQEGRKRALQEMHERVSTYLPRG